MNSSDRMSFIEAYVQPVIYHPMTQFFFKVEVEVVKILAAKIFLELLRVCFLNKSSTLSQREVIMVTIVAPLLEEIVFRGIILRGIYLLQKKFFHHDHAFNEDILHTERFLRLHFASLLCAGVFFTNPAMNVKHAFFQITLIYSAYCAYGYISEEYKETYGAILKRSLNHSWVMKHLILHQILQSGCLAMQVGWDYLQKKTIEEKKAQTEQMFRIHFSAFMFANVHLLNSHTSILSSAIQFTWTYSAGVAYGYLSEKYKTLSLSILAHSFNNSLVIASKIYSEVYAPFFLLAIIVNQLVTYLLATVPVRTILSTALKVSSFFVNQLIALLTWNLSPRTSSEILMV